MTKTLTRRKQKLFLIYKKGNKAYWYTKTATNRLNRIYQSTIYAKRLSGNFKVIDSITFLKIISKDMK